MPSYRPKYAEDDENLLSPNAKLLPPELILEHLRRKPFGDFGAAKGLTVKNRPDGSPTVYFDKRLGRFVIDFGENPTYYTMPQKDMMPLEQKASVAQSTTPPTDVQPTTPPTAVPTATGAQTEGAKTASKKSSFRDAMTLYNNIAMFYASLPEERRYAAISGAIEDMFRGGEIDEDTYQQLMRHHTRLQPEQKKEERGLFGRNKEDFMWAFLLASLLR
jgi:hypothetical protein